jgi:hypothetical protein
MEYKIYGGIKGYRVRLFGEFTECHLDHRQNCPLCALLYPARNQFNSNDMFDSLVVLVPNGQRLVVNFMFNYEGFNPIFTTDTHTFPIPILEKMDFLSQPKRFQDFRQARSSLIEWSPNPLVFYDGFYVHHDTLSLLSKIFKLD